MTKKQIRYVKAMGRFFADNDQFPPMQVLADMMFVSSNAAQEMTARLERMGVIERNSVNKYKRGKNWR
jgi:Mn-dependent DtxR family transcriptional regulator